MKTALAILCAALGSACAPVPEVRLSAEERDLCLRDADPKGDVIMMSPYGVGCLEYGPARRMSGVWYRGMEESGFARGARQVPLTRDEKTGDNPEFDVFLTFKDDAEVAKIAAPELKGGCVRAIFLEFEGRKAIRRFPRPLSRDVAVIRVDNVLGSKFVGYVSTTIAGKPYLTCSK